MAHVIVVGAGVMGLVAAYQALCDGHQVSVLEAASEAGGMSAHFDFGGISLQRLYRFICRSDRPTLDLLQELAVSRKLKWKETSIGFYSRGQLIPWGNPLSLLRVPRYSLMTKLRYGLVVFACMHCSDWSTPVDGLQIADTAFYYPEDRSTEESIRLRRKMARDLSCTA